jgi:glycosyltransferase involved in cell wall biosynthesis
MTRLFAATLSRAATIITYSEAEAGLLRGWFELHGHRPRVVFVPFGVDTDYFRPQPDGKHDLDVVSIGADSHRDFPLVLRLAAKHPDLRLRIVASGHSAPDAAQVTPNVELEVDVPFGLVRERLAAARVVALPVRQNSYSGATTVLLQAMAMGKPVVVSRTHAIASGYGLSDGDNCRLVEPGDEGSFDAAVVDLLEDGSARAALGARARETVETALSWGRYADSLHGVLLEAAGRSR